MYYFFCSTIYNKKIKNKEVKTKNCNSMIEILWKKKTLKKLC